MMFFWDSRFLEPANLIGAIYNRDTAALCEMLFIRFYRITIGIAGAVSLYIIFEKLSTLWQNYNIAQTLAKWGTYTLEIYILQVIILEIFLGAVVCCDSLDVTLFNYVVSPAVSTLVLLVSLLLAKTIHRNKWLSFVLFAKKGRAQ